MSNLKSAMTLIDTHAHLDDSRFDAILEEVVTRATQSGIEKIVCIGTTAEASRKCVRIASEYPSVYAAVGIQPNYVGEQTDEDFEQICELAKEPKVVAIGETGLDYYWNEAPPELQESFLRKHLELANQTVKPFVIHMREPKDGKSTPCCEHLLNVMREFAEAGPLRGIMHSYTGNIAFAEAFVELGLMISFAGMVTYKNADSIREVARIVPDERLLVETDSPYLSPEPNRGKRPNEPAWVKHTAERIAKVRGVSFEELAQLTTANAKRLFGF